MRAELNNDIGYTPFSPAIEPDSDLNWSRLEELKKLELVVALCDGNAFRSRIAKKVLNYLYIPAISAAVGDITKQKNKILPPKSAMSFMSHYGYPSGDLPIFRAEPMRIVTKLMIACAAQVLAYCDEKHLKHVIDLSDPRLHLLYSRDPQTPQDYYDTYEQVVKGTIDFFHKHYPERSAIMSVSAPISNNIYARIESKRKQLDFSIVPSSWGKPLRSYNISGIEQF